MTTSQVDSKGIQTDSNESYNHSKLLKTLHTYIIVVSQYRLHLFNQYFQSNELNEHQDLFNVRKEILNRFQLVINELEQAIENVQINRLKINDIQQILDQPFIKEVIETSLNDRLSLPKDQKQSQLNTEEWQIYRRDLQDTKEDLHILDILIHRGIFKIDRLVNVTNLYV